MSTSLQNKVSQRVILPLFVACLIILVPHLAESNPISQSKNVWITDPIFNLGYDPQSVHFELIETKTFLPICKKILSDMNPLPRVQTIYAKYTTDSTSIYIVGTADSEKILVLRNGECRSGNPMLSITQTYHHPTYAGDSPILTDIEVMEIFKDALSRHEKAFGGKDIFLKWLDETTDIARSSCKGFSEVYCPTTYHSFQPILQQMLQNYRKN
jgi:hypothetical protein